MKINTNKIDVMVLALLYLASSQCGDSVRARKGHDWEALNRLYEKGMISNPRSKSKSVALSEEGAKCSKELSEKYFMKP